MSFTVPAVSFQHFFVAVFKYIDERSGNTEKEKELLLNLGDPIGKRIFEYVTAKNKKVREFKIENVLKIVESNVWPVLFNRKALSLSKQTNDTWVLYDNDPPLEELYSSSPSRTSYFTAGIVRGCLRAADIETNITVFKNEYSDKKGSYYYVYYISPVEESLNEFKK